GLPGDAGAPGAPPPAAARRRPLRAARGRGLMRAFQPLQVVGYVASRRGDAERGPLVRVRPEDARMRLIDNGDLVWVYGPRRHELAPVVYDESLPKGGIFVRDLAGVAITEIVKLVKMDVDHRPVLTKNLA